MPRFSSALLLTQQGSPGNPAAGQTALYAKAGDVLYYRTSGGTERRVEPGVLFTFARAGTLSVGAGTFRVYNDCGDTLSIKSVRASAGTAPTGASIIVDVNVNGTTIFTTQANRPAIAAAANTSGKVTNHNVTTIGDGSYFTVDVDQVGSGAAGADLTVQILC